MKKKVNSQQIVAGILATTFLVESCTKYQDIYYSPLPVPDINKKYNSLQSPFSVLSIPVTKEEREYLAFVNYLLGDIINNPQIAEDFMNEPERYALEAGFNDLKINLEDNLIRMIVTIADQEIRDAVINKDITRFLQLCQEKNIINNFDISNSPIIKEIIEKNPDISQFLATSSMGTLDRASFIALAVAVIAGVAVFIWAVAVTHDATVNVAVAATAVETVAAISHVTITKGFYNISQELNVNDLVLELWNIHGGDSEQTYILTSEYIEIQIESAINALKQAYPQKFAQINDDDFKQFLALNIQKIIE
jgi:hypothetical protein